MEKNWESLSKKLNREIYRASEIIEALLNEENNNIVEKSHWWKFLSTISGLPVEKLIQETKKIKLVKNRDKREIKYCKLLKIRKPLVHHLTGPHLHIRNIPAEYDTYAWIFRWIYTYADDGKIQKQPGITLSTLKYDLEKIKANRFFKRASFTYSVKNGTPEKWSEELIEVDRASL